jgi:hypothetical protein
MSEIKKGALVKDRSVIEIPSELAAQLEALGVK